MVQNGKAIHKDSKQTLSYADLAADKEAAKALHLPMAKTALTLKQIYADAPGQGAVVWQLGARGREATREMRSFFREALPEAGAAKAPRRSSRKEAA